MFTYRKDHDMIHRSLGPALRGQSSRAVHRNVRRTDLHQFRDTTTPPSPRQPIISTIILPHTAGTRIRLIGAKTTLSDPLRRRRSVERAVHRNVQSSGTDLHQYRNDVDATDAQRNATRLFGRPVVPTRNFADTAQPSSLSSTAERIIRSDRKRSF